MLVPLPGEVRGGFFKAEGRRQKAEGKKTLTKQVNTDMNLSEIINRSIKLLTGIIILLAAAGCSKQTPVAPILVLATENEFGTYTGEILKAEGFNEFSLDSLEGKNIKSSFLARFVLVILAEPVSDQGNWEIISDYVRKGGNLIAVRPLQRSEELFGITEMDGPVKGGYLAIDTFSQEGRSLTGRKLQLHTYAYPCAINRGRAIAFLTDRSVNDKKIPGVIMNNYGKGKAATFLYNLPENIILTRQGNPDFAGTDKDGIPGLRAMDLFTNGWVDTSNNIINQADEQMHLLTHIIENMSVNKTPLPRLWYFPDTLKCLVTLTNDGEYKTETDFEPQFQDVDSMGAKMSVYIIGVDDVSREWVDKWTAKGFEVAGHPDDTKEASNPDWNNMDSVIKAKKSEIAGKYGLQIRTNVNHWFVWCGRDADGKPDFAAQAKLEELNGIELDINYAHYDIKSNQGDNYLGPLGTDQGNFTGSGLPMKFANGNGKIINVYQQLNAVYDQQYNESHDPEGFFNSFKGLMDRSLNNEVYSFISVKSHNDEYYFSKIPLMKMLAYANSNGIPVWTALKLLDFIKMRDEASFTNTNWSNNSLSFNLNSSITNSNGLSIMIPHDFGNKKINGITKNGVDASFIVREVRGSDYALLTVEPGKMYQISASYR